MKYKLLSVQRAIEIHGQNEEKVGEVPLNITVSILKGIVAANNDDPEYYDGYELNDLQLAKLKRFAAESFEVVADNSYFLIANGIYDWNCPVP